MKYLLYAATGVVASGCQRDAVNVVDRFINRIVFAPRLRRLKANTELRTEAENYWVKMGVYSTEENLLYSSRIYTKSSSLCHLPLAIFPSHLRRTLELPCCTSPLLSLCLSPHAPYASLMFVFMIRFRGCIWYFLFFWVHMFCNSLCLSSMLLSLSLINCSEQRMVHFWFLSW